MLSLSLQQLFDIVNIIEANFDNHFTYSTSNNVHNYLARQLCSQSRLRKLPQVTQVPCSSHTIHTQTTGSKATTLVNNAFKWVLDEGSPSREG